MIEQREVNVFLDILRSSGVTNMWGAGPYIMNEFGCTRHQAQAHLLEWMKTFSDRKEKGEVVC